MEVGLADKGAEGRSAAETAHAGDGEVHMGIVYGGGGGQLLVVS